MLDKRTYLKVKIKSLAEEAKIIRFEERKNKVMRRGLEYHRKTVVRSEARNTLIAYAFIRGIPYSRVESKAKTKPDWEKVRTMVQKYGCRYDAEGNENWTAYQVRKKIMMETFEKWVAIAQGTECQPAKLEGVGSNPISHTTDEGDAQSGRSITGQYTTLSR